MSELDSFSASQNRNPPRRLGQRYDKTQFLPEAGNTVVCHLDTDDPAHHLVLDARRTLAGLPGADRLLFTPQDSLHMTLMDGVIDTRRSSEAWPAGIKTTVPVQQVTEMFAERLKDFAAPDPFSVTVADVHPGGLLLEGATPKNEALMRVWRDALVAPLGFRRADHESYRFHMTFAYPVDWISDEDLPQWRTALQEIYQSLKRQVPVVPLRAPAFCRFADMTYFEELVGLTR